MHSLTTEQQRNLDKAELIYSLAELDQALEQTAQQLNQRFYNDTLIVIAVMNGGLVTTGQVLPKLNFSVVLDYVHVTRYGNQTHGGDLQWHRFPAQALAGQKVLLVDDIFDEGQTLASVAQYCYQQGAEDVVSVVLLEKRHERKVIGFKPDYSVLSVPDTYVFGFGMDYHGFMRNASGIFSLVDG